MPTARQISAAQKRARKERERDARKADRERLRQVRAHIRAAKKHSGTRRKEVVLLCRRGRVRAREAAKLIRARYRAQALAEIDATRVKSRNECEVRKTQARTKNSDSLARAQAAFAAEKKHQAVIKVWARPTAHKAATRRRFDALSESDSDVTQNIPGDLVPVWKAVKSRIKGSPRRTRAEAFLEWAQAHPGDVIAILDAQIQKDVAKLVAEEKQLRRDVRHKSTYTKSCDAGLSKRYDAYRGAPEVPF